MRVMPPILIAALLLCADAHAFAQQNDQIFSAKQLTKEQFVALPPEAVIDFDGRRMTKRNFIRERAREAEQAGHQMRLAKVEARHEFERRRAAFLADERAKLEAANREVRAEVNRLIAAENAVHGANWQNRKRQAAVLLAEAAKAPTERRLDLEKRAAGLLGLRNERQ